MDFKTIQEVIKKKQEEVELIQAEIMLQEKKIQNLAYDLEDIEDVQKKSSTDLLESISPIDPASMIEEILQLRSKIIDRINKMKNNSTFAIQQAVWEASIHKHLPYSSVRQKISQREDEEKKKIKAEFLQQLIHQKENAQQEFDFVQQQIVEKKVEVEKLESSFDVVGKTCRKQLSEIEKMQFSGDYSQQMKQMQQQIQRLLNEFQVPPSMLNQRIAQKSKNDVDAFQKRIQILNAHIKQMKDELKIGISGFMSSIQLSGLLENFNKNDVISLSIEEKQKLNDRIAENYQLSQVIEKIGKALAQEILQLPNKLKQQK